MGEFEAEGGAGRALEEKGREEEVRKEEGKVRERKGRGWGVCDGLLGLSMSLQVCSQPHLWCAQLQGSAGQVGRVPSLGGGGPCLAVSSHSCLPAERYTGSYREQGAVWCPLPTAQHQESLSPAHLAIKHSFSLSKRCLPLTFEIVLLSACGVS